MAPAADDEIRPDPAEPAAEPPPPMPPGMPPADEPGFPPLPMFGGEANELFNSMSAAQSVFSLSTALRDGVMTSGTSILSENSSQAQVGTQLVTSRGTLKAELVSAGMLQTTVEGFQPLSFVNMNLQLAFFPTGLAGGVLQTMLLTPVGMALASMNTGGQISGEFITGGQTSATSQVMLGCHVWGTPLVRGACGVKAALEVQHMVLDEKEEMPVASSALTLACTAPFVAADGTKLSALDPSMSLSVFQRLSPLHSVAVSIERAPKDGIHLTAGGTRQLSDSARLRGKWGTQGVLAFALEMAGEKSSLTFTTELKTEGALAPKFGAQLSMTP